MSDLDEMIDVTEAVNALNSQLQPDWENPPTIQDLKNDLVNSSDYHYQQVRAVEKYLDTLHASSEKRENRTKSGTRNSKIKTKSSFESKLVRKQAEWRYPSLSEPFLNTPKLFKVRPRTFDDVERARQNELILNMQFGSQINKVNFVDRMVRAAVDEGTAIIRSGWEFVEVEEEYESEEIVFEEDNTEQGMRRMKAIAQSAQQDPDFLKSLPEHDRQAIEISMANGVPVVARKTGKVETKTRTRTLKNQPTVEVCDFRDVICDPSCQGDASKAKFFIHRFYPSLAELKMSSVEYQNLDELEHFNNELGTSATISEGIRDGEIVDGSSFNFVDKTRQLLEAYEYWGYWDIHGDGTVVPIVATFVGDLLIRLEENPYNHRMLPFDVIALMPQANNPYGEPDGALIADNQQVISAIMRGAIDTMAKSANGQTAFVRNALDPTNEKRFVAGDNFVVNNTTGGSLKEIMHQFVFPELPSSVYNLVNMNNMEAESYTGVRSFNNGVNGDALGSSVGGIRSALDAAGKREASILRRFVEGLTNIARKIISMNNQFLDEEVIVRITNEDFVEIDPSDLLGDYDLEIDVSTLEEDNLRAQELAFMLQTMGNNVPFDMTKKLLAEIARLRRMPDLAKELESYEPQPDPMQQQMAQLEMELKQAEIADKRASAMEREAGARERIAKAQKALAEAGKTDLDSIEQETGTAHVRDLETQKAQARGNIELEAAKASFNNKEEPTNNNVANN